MKGFIVASINKKAVRQSLGLESQVIRYTPAMAETQEDVVEQYQEAVQDYMVVMAMPIDILKNNIEVVKTLPKQKGFIVAGIHKKAMKQSVGLKSQIIRYTPATAETQEDVVEQYQKTFPDYMIIMAMPVDVLKKNIEVVESLAKQKELILEV